MNSIGLKSKIPIPKEIIRHINWRGTKADLEREFFTSDDDSIWVNKDEIKMIKKKSLVDYFPKIEKKIDLSSSDSEQEKSMVKSWSNMDKNDIQKSKNNVKNSENSDDDFIVATQEVANVTNQARVSDDSSERVKSSEIENNDFIVDTQPEILNQSIPQCDTKSPKCDPIRPNQSSSSSDTDSESLKIVEKSPPRPVLKKHELSPSDDSLDMTIRPKSPIKSQNPSNVQKPKKKSLTMKDFVIPSPKTSVDTSVRNTEPLTNVLDIEDLGTKPNLLYMEDIESNDEIYILQCPKEVDYTKLKEQAVSLTGESVLKFGAQNYESFTQKEDLGRILNIVLPSRTSRTFSMGLFPLAGSIILTESMDVPEIKEFETVIHDKIPLPDFKDIHKSYSDLSDSSYKEMRQLEKSQIENMLPIKKKSKEFIDTTIKSVEMEVSPVKKKKTKKQGFLENSFKDISNEIVMEETLNEEVELSHKKKKKKKSCVEDKDISVKKELDISQSIWTEETDIESTRKKKKKKKSRIDDNGENRLDVSGLDKAEESLNGEVELPHKKKKKKKSYMDESSFRLEPELEVQHEPTEHKKKKKKKHDISQDMETSQYTQDENTTVIKQKKKKKTQEIDLNGAYVDNKKRKRESQDYEPCPDAKKIKNMDDTILISDEEIKKVKKKKKQDNDFEMNLSHFEEIADVDKPKKKKKHKKQEEIEVVEIVEHKKKKKKKKRQEDEA